MTYIEIQTHLSNIFSIFSVLL